MKVKYNYTKFIIQLSAGILGFIAVSAFVAYLFMIYPRTLADLTFENRMKQELEQKGELRMTDITYFDWDTMYYSWNGYMYSGAIEDYVDDKNNILRDTNYEMDNHLLFVKDNILVRQIIINRLPINFLIEPYFNNRDEKGTRDRL